MGGSSTMNTQQHLQRGMGYRDWYSRVHKNFYNSYTIWHREKKEEYFLQKAIHLCHTPGNSGKLLKIWLFLVVEWTQLILGCPFGPAAKWKMHLSCHYSTRHILGVPGNEYTKRGAPCVKLSKSYQQHGQDSGTVHQSSECMQRIQQCSILQSCAAVVMQ